LTLHRSNGMILMDWYHKKTFSGRFLSFYSNHPLCHKVGTIYGLIDRAFLLSDPVFHKKNIELIINLLLENGYPLSLIFEKINARIKTLIYNNTGHEKEDDNGGEDRNNNIIVLPYIKDITERVAGVIDGSRFLKGYRVLNNLGKIIKVHKDRNDALANSNVVYKIKCINCNAIRRPDKKATLY